MARPLWSLCALLLLACNVASSTTTLPTKPPATTTAASGVQTVTITVGPFDIHKRYRSMEGPYVLEKVRISDLVARKDTVLGAKRVKYVEGGTYASMNGGEADSQPDDKACATRRRTLYWLRGMTLEVLDEQGKPMPSAEFICHMNLDVDSEYRNRVFPESERCTVARILTLTQGQTSVTFPEGYGVPVASDEQWTFTFQAANRTTDEHRVLKHRLKMDLIEDKDLLEPIQPLAWVTPYLSVVVGKNSPEAAEREKKEMPGCLPTTVGLVAPNSVPNTSFDSWCGNRRSGHWVVAPGRHTYQSGCPELRVPSNRTVRMVWSHVHPLLESASMIECSTRKPLFTVTSKTRTEPGLEIEEIKLLTFPEGLLMKANTNFEIQSVYNNTTKVAQDSMVALGVFFDDVKFARPKWVLENQNEEVNCMVHIPNGQGTTPMFDVKKDGPLLKSQKKLTLQTSKGPIHLVLEPKLAPITATQIARLLEAGVYDHTQISRYESNFVLQFANAEQKAPGAVMDEKQASLLRRLPLEVHNQPLHQRNVLSMARYEDPNSGVSSFSILLGAAPHLDGKYTVFGWVGSDPETQATLKALTRDFVANQETIVSVH